MSNVLLIGAYPPPIGGNSVHIKRLRDILAEREGIHVSVLDIYNENRNVPKDYGVRRIGPPGFFSLLKAIGIIYRSKADIVHFHVSAMGKFVYIGYLLLLFTPDSSVKVITIHSGSFVKKYNRSSRLAKYSVIGLLKKFSKIVAVGIEQRDLLVNQGINKNNIIVLPAYLPPVTKADDSLDQLIAVAKNKGRKMLVSSGYGIKLYGFHKVVQVIEDLGRPVSLVLCIYNQYDDDYMSYLSEKAAENNNIHILKDLSPESFAYILKHSDGYIRATDRDGDAVAIREAYNFKKPVLASSVVKKAWFLLFI